MDGLVGGGGVPVVSGAESLFSFAQLNRKQKLLAGLHGVDHVEMAISMGHMNHFKSHVTARVNKAFSAHVRDFNLVMVDGLDTHS